MLRLIKQQYSKLLSSRLMSSSSSSSVPLLLSPAQLQKILPAGDVAVVDASWYMPTSTRKPREDFARKRIPGAQFLDLDEVASPHEFGLKHMMPTGRIFADACERFGIWPSSHVVLYDTHGVFSSPRALFMFKAFGHDRSSILDGGLPRWEAEALPIENAPPVAAPHSAYPTPTLDDSIIRSYEQMVANSNLDIQSDLTAELVLDARSHGRYLGTDPEPRPGLPSGHIPRSFSLPFNVFLQSQSYGSAQYTTLKPVQELRKMLDDAVGPEQTDLIIKGERPVTTSCGSGMTAGVLWLGLQLLGVQKVHLYDESWTGYAARTSSRIETSK